MPIQAPKTLTLDERSDRGAPLDASKSRDAARTFDALPDAIIAVDSELVVRSANAACGEIFGVTPLALVGASYFSVVETDFAPLSGATVRDRLRVGAPFSGRVRQRGPMGPWRVVELRLRPRAGDGDPSQGFVCVHRDIGALETMLIDGIELDRARAIDRLSARLAHDFNNVLSVILLSLDACASQGLNVGELDDIREAARQGQALARGLTEGFADGERPFVVCDVERLTRGTCRLAQRAFRTTVEVELVIERGIPKAELPAGVLEHVLVRLLENAHEAASEGSTIVVRVRREHDDVIVEVEDAGEGIPVAHVERVHEPFFTTKTPPLHLGLGLAEVTRAVSHAKGKFRVEHRPSGGALARVSFPLRPDGSVRPLG